MMQIFFSIFSRNSNAEYKVYVYHAPTLDARLPRWEKLAQGRSAYRAIQHARLLHRKDVYETIEVKKQFFCKQQQKKIAKTFCLYDRAAPSWYGPFRALLINMRNT